MNGYLAMPVVQNAAIGMGLLCQSDTVSDDAMDIGVVVDRKSFVSRSKEENAATATMTCSRCEILPLLCTTQKIAPRAWEFKGFPVHFRLRHFEIGREAFCDRMRWVDHPNSL